MKPNLTSCSNQAADADISLILACQQSDDDELAALLLSRYESMTRMAAAKLSRNHANLREDLFQVGQMSLLKSMKSFQPDFGSSFEAYAMKSMVGVMKNYLRDKAWYVRVPRRIKEKSIQIQKAIDELTVTLERSPDIPEIAAKIGLSAEETIEILSTKEASHYVSLDAPLKPEEDQRTIGEAIESKRDEYRKLEIRIDLSEALIHLEEEERQVVHLIFVDERSQREAAQELGISQMSVSRIKRRAVQKLKERMLLP